MSYARIKQVAWRAFMARPISGIGLDNFHWATMRAYAEGSLPQLYSEIDPHSTLLGRLAECGLIGGVDAVAAVGVMGGYGAGLDEDERHRLCRGGCSRGHRSSAASTPTS